LGTSNATDILNKSTFYIEFGLFSIGEYSKMKVEDNITDPEQLVAAMEKTSTLFER
jgi:hypothetical protein